MLPWVGEKKNKDDHTECHLTFNESYKVLHRSTLELN